MAYDYNTIKQIWILNGGNPAAAGIAAAVALAESSGNPSAINYNSNGSVDRGLWQINSIHGAQSTFDITNNAKAAIAISKNGTDWSPWVTYTSGAWRKYLNPADPNLVGTGVVDIQAAPPSNPLDSLKDIAAKFSDIASTFGQLAKAGAWLSDPHNTIRITQVVVGSSLIIVGLVILNRGLIMDAVGKVADVTKVAGKVAAA